MIFRAFLGVLFAFAITGCESVRRDFGTGIREKFTGPAYQTRRFGGEARVIFDAARTSAEQLGFRITRAGPAQGVIEGVSGLASDDRLEGSRQRTIKIRVEPVVDGGTELGVLFTEIVEDDFSKGAGQGTEATLRNSSLYEAFFSSVNHLLIR
ncbi:MAG: hypothetical protein K0R17_279 [Rariglobus sp.]|jgi:hypothetical protein|nr:hypothetical protein [Rariglobus sp.]